MKEINDAASFEKQVLQAKVPVLVDFFATWCGPCRLLGPVITQLETALDGKALIAKVDVDKASDLAQQWRIFSVPTIMLFNNGQLIGAYSGERTVEAFKNWIASKVQLG